MYCVVSVRLKYQNYARQSLMTLEKEIDVEITNLFETKQLSFLIT